MNKTNNLTTWSTLAKSLELPTWGLVEGRAFTAASGETFQCVNPATGKHLALVTSFDDKDVDAAVRSAREAFETSPWAKASGSERKKLLLRFADLVEANAPSLALMDSLSMGKPVEYAMTSDLPGSVAFIRWYAECIDKIYDQVAPSNPNSRVTITREPIGVVGLITPWNYPIEEAAMKIAPALAAGNTIVLKPPEISPFSSIRLGELAVEAGIPRGVLNIAPGLGHVAGKALALHHNVDCIGFTGSTEVAKLLMQYSGQSNLKPVWLEAGGKSPNIVFADCEDFDFAVAEAARSVLRNQGEVCTAGSRLFVEKPLLNKFTRALINAASHYRPGNPLDPTVIMGPIASKAQHQRVLGYIARGIAEGATLLLDGRTTSDGKSGYYLGPTIFGNVSNDMTIAREEIFGPVISVIPFENEEQVVELANDSVYGLAASVWTASASRAHRMARRLAAGCVTINGMDSQDVNVPFGGYKQSGIGREHGMHAIDLYTNVKTTWVHHRP